MGPADRDPLIYGAATFVVWLAYLGSGSTALYLLLTALVVGAAYVLGRRQHWGAALLILGTATLVGTEFRGELGSAAFTGGGVRLLDLVVLASGVGVAVAAGWFRLLRDPAALVAGLRPFLWAFVALAALLLLWVINGPALDALFKTDVRLLLLGVGTYVVARRTLPGNEAAFVRGLLLLGAALAAKAIVLHLSDLWAIGTWDRAQTYQISSRSAPKRTILVGGDTLIVLLPAIASSVLGAVTSRQARGLLMGVAALGFVAILLSGTRSSLLVAIGLFLVAPFILRGGLSISPRKLAAAGVVALMLLVAGTVATGVGERFTRQDGQHEGLGFREDEIRSAVHLPARNLLIGQGIGGHFVTKASSGEASVSGWSHVVLIWVVLKLGLFGLIALLVALGWGLWRVIRGPRGIGPTVGLTIFAGLMVMSLTIGRAALPEGVILTATCFVLFGWGVRPPQDPRP